MLPLRAFGGLGASGTSSSPWFPPPLPHKSAFLLLCFAPSPLLPLPLFSSPPSVLSVHSGDGLAGATSTTTPSTRSQCTPTSVRGNIHACSMCSRCSTVLELSHVLAWSPVKGNATQPKSISKHANAHACQYPCTPTSTLVYWRGDRANETPSNETKSIGPATRTR